MTSDIVDKIPWKKITAPMIPLGLADIYLGRFLYKMYTFNITNGISEGFPTNRTFYMFMLTNLFIIFIYLLLSAYGLYGEEKLKNLKSIAKIKPTNESKKELT